MLQQSIAKRKEIKMIWTINKEYLKANEELKKEEMLEIERIERCIDDGLWGYGIYENHLHDPRGAEYLKGEGEEIHIYKKLNNEKTSFREYVIRKDCCKWNLRENSVILTMKSFEGSSIRDLEKCEYFNEDIDLSEIRLYIPEEGFETEE